MKKAMFLILTAGLTQAGIVRHEAKDLYHGVKHEVLDVAHATKHVAKGSKHGAHGVGSVVKWTAKAIF